MIIVIILSTFAFLFGCVIPLFINRKLNKYKQNLNGVKPQDIEKLNAIPMYRYFFITLLLADGAIIPLIIHSPERLLTDVLMSVFFVGPLVSGLCFSILDEKISKLEILYSENSQGGEDIATGERDGSKPHGWIENLYNAE